jgi:hypothetical protein
MKLHEDDKRYTRAAIESTLNGARRSSLFDAKSEIARAKQRRGRIYFPASARRKKGEFPANLEIFSEARDSFDERIDRPQPEFRAEFAARSIAAKEICR